MLATAKKTWLLSTRRPSPKARVRGSRERGPDTRSAMLPEFLEKNSVAYLFSAWLLLIVSSEENHPRDSRPSLMTTAASFRR